MRLRAITSALWYGLLPWWLYESSCHYIGMTYGEHLRMNLQLAARWVCFKETDVDRAFEERVNA